MKRGKSSSKFSATATKGVGGEVQITSSGTLHRSNNSPCTGQSANEAHALPPEHLGHLLLDWLESMGYRRIYPEAENFSREELPFSGNQLREIGQRIAILKTEASRKKRSAEPVFLDNVDLMNLLHISPRTSRLWREQGRLSYSRVGRKIFYRLEDIERMIDSCRVVGSRKSGVRSPK